MAKLQTHPRTSDQTKHDWYNGLYQYNYYKSYILRRKTQVLVWKCKLPYPTSVLLYSMHMPHHCPLLWQLLSGHHWFLMTIRPDNITWCVVLLVKRIQHLHIVGNLTEALTWQLRWKPHTTVENVILYYQKNAKPKRLVFLKLNNCSEIENTNL